MQLEFQKHPLRYLATGFQDVKNGEVTQEVRLSEGMPDIGRVLTTWGQVVLRSKQWQGNRAEITGGVMAWTLYAPEDGTEPRSVESWLPFELKWETPSVSREGPVAVSLLLRFADSRSISSRKMMVRAGVAALAQGFCQEQSETALPEEVPEGVEVLKNIYPLRLTLEAGEKTFPVDEEISINADVPPEKLLSCSLLPEVTEKRVMSDKIAMKGRLKVHLVCRSSGGEIQAMDHELPFSQLVQLDAAYGPDAQADIRMAVTNLEADMAEPGRVRLKAGLTGQYAVTDRKQLELIQDAYSPRRPVAPEMTMLELPVVLEDRREMLSAEQYLPGQFGQMADAVFLPDFPKQRRNGSNVEMEMPGLFQCLLYGEDGMLQSANVRWEGKLSIPADEHTRILPIVLSQGDVQSVTSGDRMQLQSQTDLALQSTVRQEIPMVAGLELGQQEEPEGIRPSLILTMGGREPLWDLAKRCGSTVSAICAANGLDGEPIQEQMLLIPVI